MVQPVCSLVGLSRRSSLRSILDSITRSPLHTFTPCFLMDFLGAINYRFVLLI